MTFGKRLRTLRKSKGLTLDDLADKFYKTKALEDNPKLLDFWEQMKKRESMQLLFKQTRNMSDKAIQDVVNFMKSVEDELDRNN